MQGRVNGCSEESDMDGLGELATACVRRHRFAAVFQTVQLLAMLIQDL